MLPYHHNKWHGQHAQSAQHVQNAQKDQKKQHEQNAHDDQNAHDEQNEHTRSYCRVYRPHITHHFMHANIVDKHILT